MLKNVKKILVLILILVLIYKIIDIMAAYKTNFELGIHSDIEPWKILINNVNIGGEENKTFEIQSYLENSENVRERENCTRSCNKITNRNKC